MTNTEPSFLARVPMAFGAFFRILGNASYAGRIARLAEPQAAPETGPETESETAPAAPVQLREAAPDAALQLLALLQRDARLLDFTQENLAGYSDADIGAAARVVHEGCARVLREHFSIVAIRDESEGSRISLEPGFDAAAIRVTGNVVGQPPFTGSLSHRGWRATEVRLPKLAPDHDVRVLAPAEVEL